MKKNQKKEHRKTNSSLEKFNLLIDAINKLYLETGVHATR